MSPALDLKTRVAPGWIALSFTLPIIAISSSSNNLRDRFSQQPPRLDFGFQELDHESQDWTFGEERRWWCRGWDLREGRSTVVSWWRSFLRQRLYLRHNPWVPRILSQTIFQSSWTASLRIHIGLEVSKMSCPEPVDFKHEAGSGLTLAFRLLSSSRLEAEGLKGASLIIYRLLDTAIEYYVVCKATSITCKLRVFCTIVCAGGRNCQCSSWYRLSISVGVCLGKNGQRDWGWGRKWYVQEEETWVAEAERTGSDATSSYQRSARAQLRVFDGSQTLWESDGDSNDFG